MTTSRDFSLGLKCRVCGKLYPKQPLNFCTDDFGPLEVDYDYDAIAEAVSRDKIECGRYTHVALPGVPAARRRADRRPSRSAARRWSGPTAWPTRWASTNLWLKNDAVNFPTLSFKDRVVAVALSKAREFGFDHGRLRLDRQPGQQRRRQRRRRRAGQPTSSSRPTWSAPRSSAPASTGPRSSASRAPTTRSIASVRRSRSSTAGASSTSTCGRSTPRGPRRSATRSPSSSAGGRRSTSSARWPAAA